MFIQVFMLHRMKAIHTHQQEDRPNVELKQLYNCSKSRSENTTHNSLNDN